MKKVWLMLAVLMLAIVPVVGVSAQDDAPTDEAPVLLPFTDTAYEVQGVLPDGWEEIGSGLYARSASDTDPTLIAVQAVPGSADAVFPALLPQLGLEEVPEPVTTLETPGFTWTLYQFENTFPEGTLAFDLAIAEANNRTYLILFQTEAAEYDALHEAVFLPVVEALRPLTSDEELPYVAEDVTFTREDVSLAGTLTLPEGEGPFPAVVLVSGSGAQDRDESLLPIAEIRPFRLIADHLTRNGIAVLRYDDQGVGGSTGDVDATVQENIANASAAVDYLLTRAEIDPDRIGILGHSEGGFAAANLGANNPDVDFVIAMAGTSVNGVEVLIEQNRAIYESENATPEQVEMQVAFITEFLERLLAGEDADTLREFTRQSILAQFATMSEEQLEVIGDPEEYAATQAASLIQQYYGRWFRSFLEYDPGVDWANVTIPVLAVFGGKDVQVIAEQNIPPLEAALANNPDVTIVTLEDANHLFQSAETGAFSEYGTLAQEFTPDFLPLITDWILERFGE